MLHVATVGCCSLLMLLGLALSAGAEDAAPAPVSLGKGVVQFTPPPADGWERIKKITDSATGYTTVKHDGKMQIELLPIDTAINPETTGVIVKALRAARQKVKAKVLLDPTIEADDRFSLKIHERYEVGKADPVQVADQLHLYRYLGKRMVEVTVISVAADAEAVKATHAAAEELLANATAPGEKVRKPAPAKP